MKQAEVDRGLKTGPTTEELAEIKALRKEVADQQRTIEILKAATSFFAGGRPEVAAMVRFVDEHRHRWPVAPMSAAIELPERTYYAAKVRPPSPRAVAMRPTRSRSAGCGKRNYRCYGPRRVHKQLHREGYRIARCTVGRLMGDMGLGACSEARSGSRPPPTPRAPTTGPRRPPLRGRPSERVVAGRHHVRVDVGGLAVRVVRFDVFSRTIVGWQIADHLRTDLVLDALEMAIWRRDLTVGADPSQRRRLPVHEFPLLGPAHRGRDRRVDRIGRRLLRL